MSRCKFWPPSNSMLCFDNYEYWTYHTSFSEMFPSYCGHNNMGLPVLRSPKEAFIARSFLLVCVVQEDNFLHEDKFIREVFQVSECEESLDDLSIDPNEEENGTFFGHPQPQPESQDWLHSDDTVEEGAHADAADTISSDHDESQPKSDMASVDTNSVAVHPWSTNATIDGSDCSSIDI